MAQLNQADLQEARKVAAAALAEDDTGIQAEALDIDGARELFCQHWPIVKQVLQFLGNTVGGPVGWAVRAVIAAGDFLYGRICPR